MGWRWVAGLQAPSQHQLSFCVHAAAPHTRGWGHPDPYVHTFGEVRLLGCVQNCSNFSLNNSFPMAKSLFLRARFGRSLCVKVRSPSSVLFLTRAQTSLCSLGLGGGHSVAAFSPKEELFKVYFFPLLAMCPRLRSSRPHTVMGLSPTAKGATGTPKHQRTPSGGVKQQRWGRAVPV